MKTLASAARAFAEETPRPERLLETIADAGVTLLGDVCVVALISSDGKSVVPSAVAAADNAVRASVRAAWDAVPLRASEVCPQAPAAPSRWTAPPLLSEVMRRAEMRETLSLPLVARGHTIGLLALARCCPGSAPFAEPELELAASLADHAALAIANSRLLESTERALAESRQAEAHAKTFVAVVEHSRDFIGMASLDGAVLFVNDAGRRLAGIDLDADIRSLHLSDFHTGDGLARRAIIEEKGYWQGEGVLRHQRSGEYIPTRVSSFLARDAQGRPLCFATIQHDLRETRELEARLRQSQKLEAIGRLAGGIAHDFNNLLTVVLSYASLLRESLPEGSPAQEDLSEIESAAHRAAMLTAQVLAFSRQQVLNATVLDASAVIRGMRGLIERSVTADIDVRILAGAAVAHVVAERSQIEQVVLNLVVNARDAMADGGTLTVATGNVDVTAESPLHLRSVPPGPYVVLAVTDTGTGIDDATKARMFEPFFTTKAVGRGTGLGLATVFGIVEQSGGHIVVETQLGVGTTFSVLLPRTDVAAADGASGAPTRPRWDGGTETILLVEDDPHVRTVAARVLRGAGYRVLEAPGAEHALALSAETPGEIALLLTDVVMPTMSGRALAERVLRTRPRTRVLYVSGYTDDILGRHDVLAADVHLLSKPLTPETLLAKVSELLRAG